LLRSQHEFPGKYTFRVVVRPEAAPAIVSAIGAALHSGSSVRSVDERSSRSGNYISLRILTEMADAEAVLDVNELIAKLTGVVMTL